METLQDCWSGLWKRGQFVGEPGETFEDLRTRYSEPHRRYHTFEHLVECLAELSQVGKEQPVPIELDLALWFHDAVYDTHSHDNEERSAELLKTFMQVQRMPADQVELATRLVLATSHRIVPATPLECLIVDIDLCILAKPAIRFLAYERQIRQEYFWVPWAQYVAGRTEVLQRFLDRPSVFHTSRLRDEHESAARGNLMRSISMLRNQAQEP